VLERFDVDTIELGRGFALDDAAWRDWVLPDGTACQVPSWHDLRREEAGWTLHGPSGRVSGRMPDGALYFETAYFPYADAEPDLDLLPEVMPDCLWAAAPPPGPLVEGPGGDERLVEGARRLRARTNRAIIGLLAADPDQAHDELERLT
jgi:uroporphyrinogen decarboxylase